MNNSHQGGHDLKSEEDTIDLKKILDKYIVKWKWFVLSVLVSFLLAFLYLKYTPPIYQINAKLLVSDEEKGGGLGAKAGLMDLGGLLGSKNSVDNEVEILKTRSLMEQVVRDMQLNIVYKEKGRLVSTEMYKSPFLIDITDGRDTIVNTVIRVKKLGDNKLIVSTNDIEKTVTWNKRFYLRGIGDLRLIKNPETPMEETEYLVVISSIDSRVASLMQQLTVAAANKQVSIIDLSLSYPLPQKGEDILNSLISKYTRANLRDKNAIADSTSKFIKERLNIIAKDLSDVENKVESFKQDNRLADMSEQGKLLVQNTGEVSTELAKAETQVSVLTALEKYLKDDATNKRVFPSSLISQDLVFSGLMNQYNALLVERDKLSLSQTDDNPIIQNIDAQIEGLRKGILSNIISTKNSFIVNRDRLKDRLNQAEGKISNVPEIEKNYLKLARSQEIKQGLYIFLMQKAEETAIAKTSNISVAKIIDPPKADVNPISPKKASFYAIGLLLGMILPFIYFFVSDFINTTVNSKEDVTDITHIPIIGEISHGGNGEDLIVANQSRSAISEQFRALRTNLSFYLKSSHEKVILLTSSMGGEGKSFTAINLGNILALAGKKVLLMELDLRRPGLAVKLGVKNDVGFTNYVLRQDLTAADIIKPLSLSENMFLISAGALPPNPAETLIAERMAPLIEELKKQFDYIIMDAPPIGIIADGQLLAKYADATLYLVRHRVTQKAQLNIAEDLYQSGKMKNLGIVMNDILAKSYGSGYGSGYGYNYGSYGENKKKSFIQRIFKG